MRDDRTGMRRRLRWEEQEVDAAAHDAAAIGGRAGDEGVDPAERPLQEAGEGVAEGFELAEEDLIEAAETGVTWVDLVRAGFPAESEDGSGPCTIRVPRGTRAGGLVAGIGLGAVGWGGPGERSFLDRHVEREVQLGGDLGRREVAREVPEDAHLGVAERVTRRRRFAVPLRRRRSGEHVEDVAPQERERVLAARARQWLPACVSFRSRRTSTRAAWT